ncbi:CBS domain-containing protein [Anseongella ginsenosidimutans]|uniref:CBS domain-containing protein n=1 Tax=Anseongella ginsenosidimutans TaxID=496056 RepID=A0A4R3L1R0_9SPHI|nr:CBS domain-containing protein [Anseongella ginsenosidimutans]QEC50988.1 CBS domain-containing protein [Anseongella ginsenosidimutans]TCS90362.1 CBS domain-containing protein [Anseongella ginsenosidimutans]
MLAVELLSDYIPALKTSNSVQTAFDRMDEFRVSHLPVVNGMDFLGLVSDQDLIEIADHSQPIGTSLPLYQSVQDSQHVYDVIRMVHELQLTAVPVVDEKKKYLGLISMNSLVTYFAQLTAVDHPGGIVVLELGARDFQLSEIARIVEANDAFVLSSYIRSFSGSTKLELTMKISKTDLTHIIASFERFNYLVKASFHQASHRDDTMDRFDSFMHYLNI